VLQVYSLANQNRFYKKAAAFCLRAVARHSPELATAVADCGALDAMVTCLEDFDPGVKEGAAWALGYIAAHNGARCPPFCLCSSKGHGQHGTCTTSCVRERLQAQFCRSQSTLSAPRTSTVLAHVTRRQLLDSLPFLPCSCASHETCTGARDCTFM
jgi:Armadillo/beta-catenin-like repeat